MDKTQLEAKLAELEASKVTQQEIKDTCEGVIANVSQAVADAIEAKVATARSQIEAEENANLTAEQTRLDLATAEIAQIDKDIETTKLAIIALDLMPEGQTVDQAFTTLITGPI